MDFSSNRHASPPQEENVVSTERSENTPCHSPLDSNRGTYEKLEIAAND